MKEPRFFEDILENFSDAVIFLDIDGTLAPDGSPDFSDDVFRRIRAFEERNHVVLTTNKRAPRRADALERLFALPVVTRRHKKPSAKVLEEAAGCPFGQRIVIGDKVLTDGAFAKRIGGRFIRVKRKLSGREPFLVRASYFLDDCVWSIIRKLFS